ncbi:type IV conjugative transfer system protein TraL [Neisseria sp.]|uniref:type IV conjugative transfer system protein TraL n=1 Tax=Neisseria sp. TaxID=192066 RepID=UPI00359F5A15
MNEQKIVFPQYIDNYAPVMFWEVDDFIPVVAGFEIGVFADMFINHSMVQLFGIAFGCYLAKQYIKSKQNNLSGMLYHKLYRWGIVFLNKFHKYGLMKRWVH